MPESAQPQEFLVVPVGHGLLAMEYPKPLFKLAQSAYEIAEQIQVGLRQKWGERIYIEIHRLRSAASVRVSVRGELVKDRPETVYLVVFICAVGEIPHSGEADEFLIEMIRRLPLSERAVR